ncbi:protein PERCC1 [Amia ocellicauda]|uniref:protein PERCC1 n=1 Tax=Amia ocellicauda TaxID=2972642 RepID=UPI003463C44F
MAAGVIRTLTDFRLAMSFQHPFYSPADNQADMDFQDASTEEEEEDEEEEQRLGEEEEMEEEEEEEGESSCLVSGQVGGEAPSSAEVTYRLLRFVDLINGDIQRYFGRKSKDEDPDACDIYEDRDRLFPCKSGRERYYADLVKMAQTGEQEEEEAPHSPLTPPGEADCQVLRALCSQEHTQQLGPLAELFDYGLRRYIKPQSRGPKQGKRHKGDRKHTQVVPMYKRRLPPSFWAEPSPNPACLLGAPNTPDFSDLLANWTSENSHELQGEGRDSPNELNRQTLETAHIIASWGEL